MANNFLPQFLQQTRLAKQFFYSNLTNRIFVDCKVTEVNFLIHCSISILELNMTGEKIIPATKKTDVNNEQTQRYRIRITTTKVKVNKMLFYCRKIPI